MKQMDKEVKEFHNHMAISMAKLMKTFTEGFTALDKAKQDEKTIDEPKAPAQSLPQTKEKKAKSKSEKKGKAKGSPKPEKQNDKTVLA